MASKAMALKTVALLVASSINPVSSACSMGSGDGTTCEDGTTAYLGECCGSGSCDVLCDGCTCKTRCRSYDTDGECGVGYVTKDSYPAETNSQADCCDASCSLHTCSQGLALVANAASIKGSADAACCEEPVEEEKDEEGESTAQIIIMALVASAAAAGAAAGGAGGGDAPDVGSEEADNDSKKKSNKPKSVVGIYENKSGEIVKVSVAAPDALMGSIPCVDANRRITVSRNGSPGEKLVRQKMSDDDTDATPKMCYQGKGGEVRLEVASDTLITLEGAGKFTRKPPSKLVQCVSSAAMLAFAIISLVSEKYLAGGLLLCFTVFSFALQVPGSCLRVLLAKIISLPPKMLKIGSWNVNFRDAFWTAMGTLVALLPCIPAFMSNVDIGMFLGAVICVFVLLDLVCCGPCMNAVITLSRVLFGFSFALASLVFYFGKFDVAFPFDGFTFDVTTVTFSVFLSAALVMLKGLTEWLKNRLVAPDLMSLVPDLDDLTLSVSLPEVSVNLQDLIDAGLVKEGIAALRSMLEGKLMDIDYLKYLQDAAHKLMDVVLKKAVETARMLAQNLFQGAFQELKSKAEAHMTTACAAFAARGLHDGRNRELVEEMLPEVEQLVEDVLRPGAETCTTISETLRTQVDTLDSTVTKAEYLVGLDIFQSVRVGAWLLKMRSERIATAAEEAKTSCTTALSSEKPIGVATATFTKSIQNIQKGIQSAVSKGDKLLDLTAMKAARVLGKIASLDTLKSQLAESRQELQVMCDSINEAVQLSESMSVDAAGENKTKIVDICALMDRVSESAQKVAAKQDDVDTELAAKTEKVSELTKERLEKLIEMHEGGNDALDAVVGTYCQLAETVSKARGIHGEMDEVVSQVESLSEQLSTVAEQGAALVASLKANDAQASAEVLEEHLDKVGAFLASPTVAVMTSIEALGSQALEKLFDNLAKALDIELDKLEKKAGEPPKADEADGHNSI